MKMTQSVRRYFRDLGKRGGQSKSPKKIAAAKRNALISKEKRLLRKIQKLNTGDLNAR